MPGAGIGLFQVACRGQGPGGPAPFSPLSLFSSGEEGAWYDPSDLTTLFQDAAGTVPVTADGQPVRLMLDKSGRNNHATAPSDAARPLYRTAGGLHWLEFDGVDDTLVTAASFTIAAGFFHANALSIAGLTGGAAAQRRIGLGDGNINRCGLFIRASGTGGASAIGQDFRISGASNFSNLIGTAFTVDVPFVALNWHESQTLFTKAGALSDTDAANYGATSVAAQAYSIQHLAAEPGMDYYGGLYVDREPTADERAETEALLAEKSGVTLP